MTFKSLILGSAAAIVLAGSAQAADLAIAEPVDYVKVCDAFGKGFFYSPGTDTCIKVGGYLKFVTQFGDNDYSAFNKIYKNSTWNGFYTEASIQLTASSITEYGNLTGWIDYRARTGNDVGSGSIANLVNAQTNSAYVDTAWLQFGPIKAGRFDSLFDFGQGFDDTGMFASDTKTDHIELSYAINGFGLTLSLEDNRDRGAVGNYDVFDGNGNLIATGGQTNMPDIVGAVTYASGIFSTKVAGAYFKHAIDISGGGVPGNPYTYDSKDGFAVGGIVELALDSISKGDKVQFSASYAQNGNSFTGITGGTSVANLSSSITGNAALDAVPGNSWSAFTSYKHVWNSQIWTSVSGGYASFDSKADFAAWNDRSFDAWRVGTTTNFTPVKGLDLLVDVFYSSVSSDTAKVKDGDAWQTNIFLKRSW
ncbi:outer membrane protein [Kaistia sp. 32K]|uniref:porin n=1 Tax=Kaistia sp. 32K TaxID=2795690 RepID=UPI001916BAB0|nr:porin [Kaistia sp. 32K]BCP53882.1 outer membrane protein [Kaistia sp. 32K]